MGVETVVKLTERRSMIEQYAEREQTQVAYETLICSRTAASAKSGAESVNRRRKHDPAELELSHYHELEMETGEGVTIDADRDPHLAHVPVNAVSTI